MNDGGYKMSDIGYLQTKIRELQEQQEKEYSDLQDKILLIDGKVKKMNISKEEIISSFKNSSIVAFKEEIFASLLDEFIKEGNKERKINRSIVNKMNESTIKTINEVVMRMIREIALLRRDVSTVLIFISEVLNIPSEEVMIKIDKISKKKELVERIEYDCENLKEQFCFKLIKPMEGLE
jgi:hypothetical protein